VVAAVRHRLRVRSERISGLNRKTRLLIGLALAGVIGPALGVSGNAHHSWGMTIAAVLFSLSGVGLLLSGIFAAKEIPGSPDDDSGSVKDE